LRRFGNTSRFGGMPKPAIRHYDPKATPWNEPDQNEPGIPWLDETTEDLKRALASGDSIEEAAMFLQYWPKTVRAKMKELGFKEKPRARPGSK
jgi:hypothetical protein